MKFRTTIKTANRAGDFRHTNKVLTIGSCFANHLTDRLHKGMFDVTADPFGILFNPESIAISFENALTGSIDDGLIIERQGYHFHYDYHSAIGAPNKVALIETIQSKQKQLKAALLTSDRLVMTFGTAWAYQLLAKEHIVANCHKVPQHNFNKELLDLTGLKERYLNLFAKLKELNPSLEIVLTVSPVRHIKNGLNGNNLSKSILLLLTNYLANELEYVSYFPSYEVLMDDLRDYRFFKEDLIHPTDQAVDYVMEVFEATFFDLQTKEIVELAGKLSRLKAHKQLFPTNETTLQHENQIRSLEAKISKLKAQL